MTDREMLEYAAKAAGIALEWDDHPNDWAPMFYEGKTYHFWDPLKDDGDALRLAVTLRLQIEHGNEWVTVAEMAFGGDISSTIEISSEISQEAATREAIVRVAAAIGKAMP